MGLLPPSLKQKRKALPTGRVPTASVTLMLYQSIEADMRLNSGLSKGDWTTAPKE